MQRKSHYTDSAMAMVPTNAPTRYQVAVYHKDGRKFVLGYTARKSRYGIDDMLAGADLAAIREFTGLSGSTLWKVKRGAYVFGDWSIGFTGTTERDTKNRG